MNLGRRGSKAAVRLPVAGLLLTSVLLSGLPDTGSAADFVSGSLRGGYWTSDRMLDNEMNFLPGSLWLKSDPEIGGGVYGRAEGWVGGEPVHDDLGQTRGDLREFVLGWRNESLDISFGRRVIGWGRADWYNPTDFIANRDYTLLFPSDDDQRRGSVVGSVSYAFGDTTATVLWAPEFRPNIYPIPDLPGVAVNQGTDRLSLAQYAFRLDHTAGSFDWAVSYFNGVDRDPGARLIMSAPDAMTVDAVYNRVQRWGADFATNLGSYGLRGEIAYTEQLSYTGNLFNPNSYTSMVLGADHNITEHFNLNLQYTVHDTIGDQTAPLDNGALAPLAQHAALIVNQGRRLQHGPTLHVRYSLLNDTLQLELSAVALLSDHSYAIRPRATYALTDTVKLLLGGDVLQGPSDSLFGQLRANTTFFAEVQYAF